MSDLTNTQTLQTTAPPREAPQRVRVRPIGGHMGDMGFEMDDEIGTSSESQGLRAGSLSFNTSASEVVENAVEQAASKVKKLGENAALFGESILDLGKMVGGQGEYSIKYQPAETPETEEEQIQEAEFKFTQEKTQETEAAVQSVYRAKEDAEDERAGLAGMSADDRAEKAGVQGGFRLVEALRNSYTRVFTGLKEKWTAQRESMKGQKPFEVVQGRFNKLGNLLKLNAQEGNSQVANQIMGAG